MIVGYILSGPDNDSYMTGTWNKIFPELKDVHKCSKCGYRLDHLDTNKNFRLKKQTADFSYTYDGIPIVSLKFKKFCLRFKYPNVVFIDLPQSPNFFQFQIVKNTIPFAARSKENLCQQCRQYENVIGPILLLQNFKKPLKNGFYQSDLAYGSGNEKSPLIIVAPQTKQELEKENLQEVYYKAI